MYIFLLSHMIHVLSIQSFPAHIDDLFPHFMAHARIAHQALFTTPELMVISDLTSPETL